MNPVLVGSALAIFSATVYTATNICLREVARCDPFWVSCMKTVPSLLLAMGLLVYRWWGDQPSWPAMRVVVGITFTGLIAQVFGNVLFQYSLGVVGLALSVPLTFGTLILGGALLGRVWLREPITLRATAAMVLLIISIVVLSTGADAAERAVEPAARAAPGNWHVAIGVAAACLSGVAYALLGVVIRWVVPGKAPLGTTLFLISGIGAISLGLCTWWRMGWSGMAQTSGSDLACMVWAGVFNAVAFVALIKALQMAPVVHVNAVNSSQTALAAVAGILLFREPFTPTLAIGVVLTTVGLLLLDHKQ